MFTNKHFTEIGNETAEIANKIIEGGFDAALAYIEDNGLAGAPKAAARQLVKSLEGFERLEKGYKVENGNIYFLSLMTFQRDYNSKRAKYKGGFEWICGK